jgi:hypothetical protein
MKSNLGDKKMVFNQKSDKIVALYFRVSKDDLKGGKINESNSITNQRIYLEELC